MKRGRPKQDDILTSREWEVLSLLRQGLTNEQIADRLKIAPSTAKFHVSEILSKLGVRSRREAARWQGEPKQRAVWLPFPLFEHFRPRPKAVALIAATVLVMVLGLVAVLSGTGKSSTSFDDEPHVMAGGEGEPVVAPVAIAVAAGEVPLTVCFSDDTWQRPSREEHERYMTTEYRPIRYGVEQGLTGRIEEAYRASFWSFGFSASGLFSMTDMSGLWSSGLDMRYVWSGACEGTLDSSVAIFNLWLLGYTGESASLDDRGILTVRVRSKAAGFQAVQVRIGGGPICCPPMRYEHVNQFAPVKTIQFVGPDGVLLETLADGIWSRP